MAVVKRIKPTPKALQKEYYSDFSANFLFEKGDLVRITNEEALKQSLRNIFLTDEDERFFSTLGAGMKKLLFEPISPLTENLIETRVNLAIKNYEPRVQILETTVRGDEELNGYTISIKFSTINTNNPVVLNFILQRVR